MLVLPLTRGGAAGFEGDPLIIGGFAIGRSSGWLGVEPPWAWYRYMQLREALDAIIVGMDSISCTAEVKRRGELRLVGDAGLPNDAAADAVAVTLPV